MAVRFILGRSGTGKTSYCVKSIVEALLDDKDDRQLLFLVPEQATFQVERAILSDCRISGYNRLNVLSFDRLEYLLQGRKLAFPSITHIGRQMIIQRLLASNKDNFKIFGKTNPTCGFSKQMADAISELCRYGKTEEDLKEFTGKISKEKSNSMTALKFKDIATIFRQYTEFINGRFIDTDIQLNSLRKVIEQSEQIKGARLWVDGFAGFTGAEYQVLSELLRVCSETEIALCLDTDNLPALKENLNSGFEPTEITYAKLSEIISKSKLKMTKPVILKKAFRFESNPELGHLEKSFFEILPKKIKSNGKIQITTAANPRSEILVVAKEINKLVREKGYRYRDIAVIAPTLDNYEHYIKGHFADKDIPYFIDKRQSLDEHIVVKYLCSALAAVTNGFGHDDIFSYLKSGLAGIDNYKIDSLENYCIAFGVLPDDWTSKHNWQFAGPDDNEFNEKQINATRTNIIKPLLKFRDALGCKEEKWIEIGPDDFTKAVFDFISDSKVFQQLAQWIENALANNQRSEADKHRQFCEKFTDVFNEMTEAFKGQKLTCSEWMEILVSGLSQMTFALIPPSLDQVLVGSIERSRHPDLKAVFIIGCTQKQYPSPLNYNGLFSETDRATANLNDFELGPGLGDNLKQREYLAYIAFTRPSEYLYISYPLLEGKTSSAVHSQFISRLESMFEDLHVESVINETSLETVETINELIELLCRQLGKEPSNSDKNEQNRLNQLFEEMSGNDEFSQAAQYIKAAINYDNRAALDSQITKELFQKQITSSATRLETFAACPYQYFVRYELGLKERKEFKLRPLDKGLFYHKALDAFMKELFRQKTDIAKLTENELIDILGGQIKELVQNDIFIRNFSEHSKHNKYIISSACDNLEKCVLAIAKMTGAGIFRPIQSEKLFEDYKIKLSDSRLVVLRGKIDRIDSATIDGEPCAIIFDYKLRGRTYSWTCFYYGIDIQLVIYMLALANNEKMKLKPVGAFYIPIETGTAKKEKEFGHKAKGIFNGEFFSYIDGQIQSRWSRYYNFEVSEKDGQYCNYGKTGALKSGDFEKILEFGRQKIIELAQSIAAGIIDVNPYRFNNKIPCSFCPYKSVCRFDWQINDYRLLTSINKTAVLEKI